MNKEFDYTVQYRASDNTRVVAAESYHLYNQLS